MNLGSALRIMLDNPGLEVYEYLGHTPTYSWRWAHGRFERRDITGAWKRMNPPTSTEARNMRSNHPLNTPRSP